MCRGGTAPMLATASQLTTRARRGSAPQGVAKGGGGGGCHRIARVMDVAAADRPAGRVPRGPRFYPFPRSGGIAAPAAQYAPCGAPPPWTAAASPLLRRCHDHAAATASSTSSSHLDTSGGTCRGRQRRGRAHPRYEGSGEGARTTATPAGTRPDRHWQAMGWQRPCATRAGGGCIARRRARKARTATYAGSAIRCVRG